MPIAVIAFDFDPLLRLGDDLVVRWQTVALAAVIAAVLLVAAWLARRDGLRPDDLLYIVVGVVPGAVIGGRLGYAVVHLDAFSDAPLAILDPAQPGLELAAAVLGGLLSGAYVASLLGAPVARWAGLLAVPLLIALGAGKLTMMLGGSGQGLPDGGAWATAYLGPGPWGSLAPELPSHPSQAYEGLGTLLLAVGLIVALAAGVAHRPDGRLLLAAIGGWAIVRAIASLSWRDPAVVGPFGVGGVLAIALAIGCLAGIVAMTVRRPSSDAASGGSPVDTPAWPDPEARPPF
ncbi:MAG TPA: prolipoprotein diacylglyceryl transferase family protein [Candidatus Saccharimonadales bacterium]|nr:prolipoprotein diacylglyceryl transferase family protein [Candidatus Saccharimonadales bacterium]